MHNQAKLTLTQRANQLSLTQWAHGLAIGLLAMSSIPTLYGYLISNTEIMTSLVLLVFAVRIENQHSKETMWSYIAWLFSFLYVMLGLTSFLYFAIISLILWAIERYRGHINHEAILIAFISSPFMIYFIKVFGFPIRLALSSWSATMLSQLSEGSKAEGNNIVFKGATFTVEPVCMGLNMVIVAWVLSLCLLTIVRSDQGKPSSLIHTGLVLLMASICVLVSNLIRILLIVLFDLSQDSFSHTLVGLLSFIVYVAIPLRMMIPLLLKFKRSKPHNAPIVTRRRSPIPILLIGTMSIMISSKPYIQSAPKPHMSISKLSLCDYKTTKLEHQTLQVENDHMLAYIKTQSNPWTPDHNPTICWTASGYDISSEAVTPWQGKNAITCVLHKSGEELYSMYWFSDGQNIYHSQWEWRLNMWKSNRTTYLVNIVAGDKVDLLCQADQLNKALM